MRAGLSGSKTCIIVVHYGQNPNFFNLSITNTTLERISGFENKSVHTQNSVDFYFFHTKHIYFIATLMNNTNRNF